MQWRSKLGHCLYTRYDKPLNAGFEAFRFFLVININSPKDGGSQGKGIAGRLGRIWLARGIKLSALFLSS